MPITPPKLDFRRRYLTGHRILDISQVLYLPFDKDDGSYARDRSGYNNHGVIYGATRAAGKVGSALSLDGADDRGEIPHSASLYLDKDFTVVCWANLETEPDKFGGVIDKGRSTVNDFWLEARRYYNQFQWGVGYTDGAFDIQYFPLVTLGAWNFYAFGVEGSQMFYSFNGGAKTYASFTRTRRIEAQNLTLGCRNNLSYYQKVKLDELRIFRKALTQPQIIRLMNMQGI